MTSLKFRGKYTEAIGFSPDIGSDREMAKAALNRAHDIRQFEIDLYWKRSTYFWAFQASSFVALGFLVKDGKISSISLATIPAGLGLLTALAGWMTAKGSKFWQENWEAHVDMLEGCFEGNLTQVVLFRGKPRFSVSRVNEALLFMLCFGWGLMLLIAAFPVMIVWLSCVPESYRGVMVLLATVLAAGFLFWKARPKLHGRRFDEGACDWADTRSRGQLSMIRRNPPDLSSTR